MTPPDPAALITQLHGRLQWYVSCTSRLEQLPDTETEDEPTQGYVRSGDLAWEVCDDLKAAITALEAAQQRESQLRNVLERLGVHPPACPKGVGIGYYVPASNAQCTCGLDDQLAAGVPQEPPPP